MTIPTKFKVNTIICQSYGVLNDAMLRHLVTLTLNIHLNFDDFAVVIYGRSCGQSLRIYYAHPFLTYEL